MHKNSISNSLVHTKREEVNLSPYVAMVLGDEPMNPTRHIDLLTYAIEIEY